MIHIPVIRAEFNSKQIMFIGMLPTSNHNKNPDIRAPIIQQLNAIGPSIFKSLKGRSTSKKSKAPTRKKRIEIDDRK
ncbi:MAG: hypothetical protein ACJA10_000861 [Oleispira sp.]|jgi:hypothetical protein